MKGIALLELLGDICQQLKEFIDEGKIVEKSVGTEFREQFSFEGEVFWDVDLCTITWACKCDIGLDSIEIVLEKLKELLEDTGLVYTHTQIGGGVLAMSMFVKFYLTEKG